VLASEFGGNPFNYLEDIWYGDNQHGTGWTKERLIVFGYYKEQIEKEKDQKPRPGGKLFLFKKKENVFQYEWDIKDEDKNG
jgi:hypothetical protein